MSGGEIGVDSIVSSSSLISTEIMAMPNSSNHDDHRHNKVDNNRQALHQNMGATPLGVESTFLSPSPSPSSAVCTPNSRNNTSTSSERSLTEGAVRAFLTDYYDDLKTLPGTKSRECWKAFYDKNHSPNYIHIRSSGNLINSDGLVTLFTSGDVTIHDTSLISIDTITILSTTTASPSSAVATITMDQELTSFGMQSMERCVVSCVVELSRGSVKLVHEHRSKGRPIPKETRWTSCNQEITSTELEPYDPLSSSRGILISSKSISAASDPRMGPQTRQHSDILEECSEQILDEETESSTFMMPLKGGGLMDSFASPRTPMTAATTPATSALAAAVAAGAAVAAAASASDDYNNTPHSLPTRMSSSSMPDMFGAMGQQKQQEQSQSQTQQVRRSSASKLLASISANSRWDAHEASSHSTTRTPSRGNNARSSSTGMLMGCTNSPSAPLHQQTVSSTNASEANVVQGEEEGFNHDAVTIRRELEKLHEVYNIAMPDGYFDNLRPLARNRRKNIGQSIPSSRSMDGIFNLAKSSRSASNGSGCSRSTRQREYRGGPQTSSTFQQGIGSTLRQERESFSSAPAAPSRKSSLVKTRSMNAMHDLRTSSKASTPRASRRTSKQQRRESNRSSAKSTSRLSSIEMAAAIVAAEEEAMEMARANSAMAVKPLSRNNFRRVTSDVSLSKPRRYSSTEVPSAAEEMIALYDEESTTAVSSVGGGISRSSVKRVTSDVSLSKPRRSRDNLRVPANVFDTLSPPQPPPPAGTPGGSTPNGLNRRFASDVSLSKPRRSRGLAVSSEVLACIEKISSSERISTTSRGGAVSTSYLLSTGDDDQSVLSAQRNAGWGSTAASNNGPPTRPKSTLAQFNRHLQQSPRTPIRFSALSPGVREKLFKEMGSPVSSPKGTVKRPIRMSNPDLGDYDCGSVSSGGMSRASRRSCSSDNLMGGSNRREHQFKSRLQTKKLSSGIKERLLGDLSGASSHSSVSKCSTRTLRSMGGGGKGKHLSAAALL